MDRASVLPGDVLGANRLHPLVAYAGERAKGGNEEVVMPVLPRARILARLDGARGSVRLHRDLG